MPTDALGRLLLITCPKPTVVVRNMPGAGSLAMVNHINTVAPKTGLTIGIFDAAPITAPLLGGSNANYDASKLSWIGSMAGGTNVCITRHASPVKTWDDLVSDNPCGRSAPPTGGSALSAQPPSYATCSAPRSRSSRLYRQHRRCGSPCSAARLSAIAAILEQPQEHRGGLWLKDKKINIVAQFAIAKHKRIGGRAVDRRQGEPDLKKNRTRLPLIMRLA